MRPHELKTDRCKGCGLCLDICGRGRFVQEGGVMTYDPGEPCIDCGHCMAVCPEGALVRADGGLPEARDPERLPSAEALRHLFATRRSTRRFHHEAPVRPLLERLVEAAHHAPTGTNKQGVGITMVVDPARIETLRQGIMARYAAYARHLANPLTRFVLARCVDRRLGRPSVRRTLDRFLAAFREGGDPLFHRAPVAAFLHAGPGASTPKDDCVIALYQMVLMAEGIGLGSCLLGTAEIALTRTAGLRDLLGLPKDHTIYASAAFGTPTVTFHRIAERTGPRVTWI